MDYQQSQMLGQEIACAIENGIRNGVEAMLAAQAAERRIDRLVALAAGNASHPEDLTPGDCVRCAIKQLNQIDAHIGGMNEPTGM